MSEIRRLQVLCEWQEPEAGSGEEWVPGCTGLDLIFPYRCTPEAARVFHPRGQSDGGEEGSLDL